jgi:hypothetical protein
MRKQLRTSATAGTLWRLRAMPVETLKSSVKRPLREIKGRIRPRFDSEKPSAGNQGAISVHFAQRNRLLG